MQINIADPVTQTLVFEVILFLAVLLTLKKDPHPHSMSISHTNELKGIAILMVIFSHIGYFLDANQKFLFPLSVAGGVGVNIFLLLSGYGLTSSALKHTHKILNFYTKRLIRIFIPMWIALITILSLDFFLLHRSYPQETLVNNFLGFFPKVDIFQSPDSPLWYFSLILFYYLIFPLLFHKRFATLSPLLVFLVTYLILHFNILVPYVAADVLKLYKLHDLAFPIGMAFAILQTSKYNLTNLIEHVNPYLRYLLIIPLIFSITYTAIHSGVGEEIKYEQSISLITSASFLLIILLKNIQSRFLIFLGIYSYEIYLIHWPIMLRHDFLFKYLPASVSTSLYLGFFIILSFILQKLDSLIENLIPKKN